MTVVWNCGCGRTQLITATGKVAPGTEVQCDTCGDRFGYSELWSAKTDEDE